MGLLGTYIIFTYFLVFLFQFLDKCTWDSNAILIHPLFPILVYLPFHQLKACGTFRVFWGASGTSSQFFPFLLIWLSWVINLYEFSWPLQLRYGTQRNVVRQGCTSCIKINFINGEVLYLGIRYTFDLLKLTKRNHGFLNFSNGIEAMQKF